MKILLLVCLCLLVVGCIDDREPTDVCMGAQNYFDMLHWSYQIGFNYSQEILMKDYVKTCVNWSNVSESKTFLLDEGGVVKCKCYMTSIYPHFDMNNYICNRNLTHCFVMQEVQRCNTYILSLIDRKNYIDDWKTSDVYWGSLTPNKIMLINSTHFNTINISNVSFIKNA